MSKKQIFYCFQKALILGKSVIWGFWCTFCQDGVSFMILYSMTENKLRGISHGVPSHHSHSLNLPRSVMTQSQRFCLCECVCVCVRVCVWISACLRDKAALSSAQWEKQRSWLQTRSFHFLSGWQTEDNQLHLLSGHCCDRRKERDEATREVKKIRKRQTSTNSAMGKC